MAKPACWREIPTELSLERFEEFILPHLTVGSRGPAPKSSLHALFNYVLKLLYLGCQRKELPIERDATGRGEIHHIRIWRTFRRWVANRRPAISGVSGPLPTGRPTLRHCLFWTASMIPRFRLSVP
jgi:hypothetical protein